MRLLHGDWPRRLALAVIGLHCLFAVFSLALLQVASVPIACYFLALAWGLWKRNAAAAFGGAAFLLAGTTPALQAFKQLWIEAAVALLFVAILLRAGQLMRAQGSRGWLWPWLLPAVLVLFFFLRYQAFVMPTQSMANTLVAGDSLLVSKGAPTLRHGSVVVFRYPIDQRQTFIKRVIGLPKDRIRIENKRIFRNGQPVVEPYISLLSDEMLSYRDNFPAEPNLRLFPPAEEMLNKHREGAEIVVPPGFVFVLGDNRDASLDSRYWGFLDQKLITGSPVVIYDSTPGRSTGETVLDWFGRTKRWDRIGKVVL